MRAAINGPLSPSLGSSVKVAPRCVPSAHNNIVCFGYRPIALTPITEIICIAKLMEYTVKSELM